MRGGKKKTYLNLMFVMYNPTHRLYELCSPSKHSSVLLGNFSLISILQGKAVVTLPIPISFGCVKLWQTPPASFIMVVKTHI